MVKQSDNSRFRIIEINEAIQERAIEIILEGLEERFGFLDRTLNPDLRDIQHNYIDKGYMFLVAMLDAEPIGTGALVEETEGTGRIVRMSVSKPYRRNGYAHMILSELERKAVEQGMRRLVLETNKEWHSAIQFYTANGYVQYAIDDRRAHMEKWI